MHRPRLFTYLLTPSLTSGTLCVLLAGVILGIFNWGSLVKRAFFYDYFFGPGGLVTTLQGGSSDETSLHTGLSGAVINDLLIFLAALTAGALVLFVLEIIQAARNRAAEAYGGQGMRREFATRLVVRTLVIAAWGAYGVVTLRLLLPFCVLAARVGIHLLWQWSGFAYLLFGALSLMLCLHLHVVFIRLLVLRPRLFGGQEIVERS
jgi:hypothetical protein